MRGQEAYASYLRAARREFVQGRAATAEQIQGVYRRAAKGVGNDILALAQDAPTLRQAHLTALQTALDKRAAEMSKEILSATHQGIWKSSSAGSKGVANVTTAVAAGAFQPEQIQRMFAGINERATLAMLARTRKDGLKLSDRVWRTCETARNNVQIIVEDAVARGQSARATAKQVDKYLQPGIWKAHKLETQKRLGVEADVSYQAMRLARTEMNNAFHEGTIAANQHCPAYLGVQWQLSPQHAVPDICTDMANDMTYAELPLQFYHEAKLDNLDDWDKLPDMDRWATDPGIEGGVPDRGTYLDVEMARVQGFDRPPQLVSAEELDEEIRRGAREMYRGVPLSAQAEQFRNGPLFIGRGMYGRGTYTAYIDDTRRTKAWAQGVARDYAGRGGSILRMALSSKARVIDYDDLIELADARRKVIGSRVMGLPGLPLTPEQVQAHRSRLVIHRIIAQDEGRLAMALGYDAIDVKAMGYMVVLNRSATIVQKGDFIP